MARATLSDWTRAEHVAARIAAEPHLATRLIARAIAKTRTRTEERLSGAASEDDDELPLEGALPPSR